MTDTPVNGVSIGCGQLTWTRMDPDDVLREIAQAGYEGAPGTLDLDIPASDVVSRYASHGLRPAPPYYSAAFWQSDREGEILADAGPIARYVREMGCTELYVATEGGDMITASGKTRSERAGQITADDALSADAMARFGETLSEFGRRTLAEGVASCFHNHVGTMIETADELDRLINLSDAESVFLGLDTGHLAWAGADAAAVCARYGDRIRTLHLKDVDESVRLQGVKEGWDYRTFNQRGIFAELGRGAVDFPTIIESLVASGFGGWLIVETDVTMLPTALESAIISRDYLRTLGL